MTGTGSWRDTAHAKVNLSLRILAREVSGYHQLETVFQALELGDGVELELRPEPGVALSVTGVAAGELGPDGDNLAVRAARAFLDRAAEGGSPPSGVRIALEKRVPHGAGLGGGSSDAAAVLRGLNELHGDLLEPEELLALGGALGADVPFFLIGTPRALAWGRGDRVLPLPSLPPREVVLAVPGQGMATPLAYRLLAEHRERVGAAAAPPALVTVGNDSWEAVIRKAENDFEGAVLPARPDIRRLKDALARTGGRPALLAGSGAAVFGVFSDEGAADRTAGELREGFPGIRAIRTRTLA